MTRNHFKLLFLLVAVAFLATGCPDDVAPPNHGDTQVDGDTGNDLGDEEINVDTDILDPTGDFDGDGLINAAEDKNRNGIVDEGETDPRNPDSDGDGLMDGEEDFNQNGVYDEGEFDPLNPDSDGDGVLDGDEVTSVVCGPEMFDTVNPTPAQYAESNMALAAEYEAIQFLEAQTATFSNGSNAFGLTILVPGSHSDAASSHGQALLAVAQSGNLPTTAITQNFTLPHPDWEGVTMTLPPSTGVAAIFDFNYGAGSPNTTISTKDPSALRDEIASAVAGSPVASGETASACASVRAYWNSELRNNGDFVVSAILTCVENLSADPELDLFFDDILGGTLVAPGKAKPDDFLCEELVVQADGGEADFLWVIDNSGSMADEQVNVANTASQFMATLKNSSVDWRLGVTTSEAYGIHPENELWGAMNLAHDELLDWATGLRGVGFLAATDLDAETKFQEYVQLDLDCVKQDGNGQPIAPIDSNVCGSGYEDGLFSGVTVLEATKNSDKPSYQLRPDATVAVIWVSDEENQAFKPDDNVVIIPESDPRWAGLVDNYVSQYEALGIEKLYGFAIVGDAGVDNGGVCQPLENHPTAVEGAQHGLSYMQVAERMGGATGSVCNTDLQATIDKIMSIIIGIAASYPLKGYPIVSSIQVAVTTDTETKIIDRSKTDGWDYSPRTNSIVFSASITNTLTDNSQIGVSYLMWKESEG